MASKVDPVKAATENAAEVVATVVQESEKMTETAKKTEWARKGVDTFVAQSSKNTEALVKLANDMFQPISNRMAETAEYFKKAA